MLILLGEVKEACIQPDTIKDVQFNFQTTHLKQHLSTLNVVHMQQNIP